MAKKKKITNQIGKTAKEFEKEFMLSVKTALMAAFGFLVALSWRDVIISYFESLTFYGGPGGKLIGALIVTFLAALVIFILTRTIKREKKKKKKVK